MRFLVDAMLSARVAEGLRAAEHDAVHVRALGLARATDAELLTRARQEERVVVSADTDFGFLLASRQDPLPSVVLLRRLPSHDPSTIVALLLSNLATMAEALEQGSLVVVEERRIRVRRLPIGRG